MSDASGVVVITGAAQGLGREIAFSLARDGRRLLLLDRNSQGANETAASARAVGVVAEAAGCDVCDEAAVSAAFQQAGSMGGTELLINCAASVDPPHLVVDMPLEIWNQCLAVVLTGTFLCCKHALRQMVDRGCGKIVNFSSVAGKMPYRYRAAYAAGKAGVISLTRTLALEAGEHGVQVNCICPGPVEGERIDQVFRQRAAAQGCTEAEVRRESQEQAALRQLTRAADVVEMVRFLGSPAADRITGQAIDVDAGYLVR
jgi:NAD(P)-dependent dehydrogenase (short-subunit alcohol dehydrogenase family)